jgi:kumamolisin
MPDLVPLEGSERSELPDARPTGLLDIYAEITVTVLLRRRAEVPGELVTGPETLTSQQLAQQYGSDPADVALAREVFDRYGVTVAESYPGSRRLMVRATIEELSEVFGTTLTQVASPHPDGSGPVVHRYRSGGLSVPAELDGIVMAVLGLDDRPAARPQFRRLPGGRTPETVPPGAAPTATAGPLTALQVASFYRFPAGTDGTGQTIAIIELGGGYTASDLDSYFSGLGLATPSVTAVGVDSGSNSPGQQADGEVELDIEVAGAVAPGAAQVVYFAPNTDQGFIDAISQAVHATPTPIVISVSWGQSEDSWSSQSRTAMDSAIADAAVLGTTVCVAAGDNGSSDDPSTQTGGVHCDFPASSPHALACGGTKLVGDVSTYTISSEVVWNELANNEGAGGGGVSDVFTGLPPWQQTAGVAEATGVANAGRGVPDVAGNADPVTGYLVVVDGQQQPVGGTSAAAPLWAGLIARLAEATGKKFGLLQPLIYADVTPGTAAPGFNDIVSGNNGAYKAVPGWDACTGLGSPNGEALLTLLSSP